MGQEEQLWLEPEVKKDRKKKENKLKSKKKTGISNRDSSATKAISNLTKNIGKALSGDRSKGKGKVTSPVNSKGPRDEKLKKDNETVIIIEEGGELEKQPVTGGTQTTADKTLDLIGNK